MFEEDTSLMIDLKTYKTERKIKFPSAVITANSIASMIYRKPYVWFVILLALFTYLRTALMNIQMTRLGTNNVILRVDAKTEKIVDILTGK